MIVELSEDELFQLFGKDVKVTGSKPLTLNDMDFVLEGCDYWSDSTTRFGYRVVYRLYLQQAVKPKSPQEVAAEEAVQKAESSLKAAKEVLKTVKEK